MSMTGLMRVALAALVVIGSLASSAHAQLNNAPKEQPPASSQAAPEWERAPLRSAPEDARFLELAEFRQTFIGKRVTFLRPDGSHWGVEYYYSDGRRAVFLGYDGTCLDGHWEQKGPYYCFFYRSQPSCWLTYETQGGLQVLSQSGELQLIGKVEDGPPISCEPAAVSERGDAPGPEREKS